MLTTRSRSQLSRVGKVCFPYEADIFSLDPCAAQEPTAQSRAPGVWSQCHGEDERSAHHSHAEMRLPVARDWEMSVINSGQMSHMFAWSFRWDLFLVGELAFNIGRRHGFLCHQLHPRLTCQTAVDVELRAERNLSKQRAERHGPTQSLDCWRTNNGF